MKLLIVNPSIEVLTSTRKELSAEWEVAKAVLSAKEVEYAKLWSKSRGASPNVLESLEKEIAQLQEIVRKCENAIVALDETRIEFESREMLEHALGTQKIGTS